MSEEDQPVPRIPALGSKEPLGVLWRRLDAALTEAEKLAVQFEEVISHLSAAGESGKVIEEHNKKVLDFRIVISNGRLCAANATKARVSQERVLSEIGTVRGWIREIRAFTGLDEHESPVVADNVAQIRDFEK